MTQKTYNMKNGILHLGLVLMVALAALTGCKNNEPKDAKIESISFKQSVYEIMENNIDLNLKKELVVTPEGILDKEKITWKVDNEDVAEMSGNYLLPKGAGTVKVTATVQEKSATCTVEISEIPIESIKLTDMTLKVHEKKKIEYTTVPENIPIQRFTLKSSSSYYASIDADGIITAKYPGTFTITATAGDVTSQCTITIVEVPVKSVTLDRTSYVFTKPGETLQLIATVEPEDASFPDLTWGSSDNYVARVDPSTGLVKASAPGSCTITVYAGDGGAKATCKVFYLEKGTVTDCQGNTYPTVKIGNQWWMAENLRCSKYDTQSSKAGATLSTWSKSAIEDFKNCYYYTDVTNKLNWNSLDGAENLTNQQISKLGYAYSWCAATGLTYAYGNMDYSNQQGICPNGWHIPTVSEWKTLANAIGDDARLINSTSGWSSKRNNGTDFLGLTVLPAGVCGGRNMDGEKGKCSPGSSAYFQTASKNDMGVEMAIIGSRYQSEIPHIYLNDAIVSSYDAACVRCVKN